MRDGEREGVREGWREGGRKGGREGGREGGRSRICIEGGCICIEFFLANNMQF